MAETKREQQPFVYGSLSKEAIYLKPLVAVQAPVAAQTPITVATVAKLPKEQEAPKDNTSARDSLKRNRFRQKMLSASPR